MKPSTTLIITVFLVTGLAALPTAQAEDQGRDTAPKASVKRATKKANAKKPSTKKPSTKKPSTKKPSTKKRKNFDFTADDITADRIRPDGTAIFGRTTAKHESLIRLRTEFIGEILKSAEML
ncbi:MAG: hypothetical protein GY811_15630 [Myxococcales bacterium]|nr:hypothetical protein [Myxococcales bacterium]